MNYNLPHETPAKDPDFDPDNSHKYIFWHPELPVYTPASSGFYDAFLCLPQEMFQIHNFQQ